MRRETTYAFFDECAKIAASALRDRTTVEATGTPEDQHWFMKVDGDVAGKMRVRDGKIHFAGVEEKYQGLGLGKKLYGEVIRRQPEQVLHSDKRISDAAMRVWESMKKRPGYTVEQVNPVTSRVMGVFNQAEGPIFKAKLPAASALPANITPLSKLVRK
jgi:GNAT superfamily N-acetyltransferase